ncbi:hypothetical protein SESBI_39103 [Sesbania bispinosa]|nr:hypothetical protein SESBI_39103 [Sesbania bispinosa]
MENASRHIATKHLQKVAAIAPPCNNLTAPGLHHRVSTTSPYCSHRTRQDHRASTGCSSSRSRRSQTAPSYLNRNSQVYCSNGEARPHHFVSAVDRRACAEVKLHHRISVVVRRSWTASPSKFIALAQKLDAPPHLSPIRLPLRSLTPPFHLSHKGYKR